MSYTVNASILLTDLPVNERPAAAKAAGFDAVEFWWPFSSAVPAQQDVDGFVAAIRDAGVQLTGLNFFAGDMAGGDRGLVSWVGREGEFRWFQEDKAGTAKDRTIIECDTNGDKVADFQIELIGLVKLKASNFYVDPDIFI